MAKMVSKDSQIILNMLKLQDKMNKIISGFETDTQLLKDEKSVDLLHYYILNFVGLTKNLSGKTKKELSMFDSSKSDILQKSLTVCYPIVGDSEVLSYARSLADEASKEELKARYAVCITESEKYGE